MHHRYLACVLLGAASVHASPAAADTALSVSPTTAHPGDPVLVTVTGSKGPGNQASKELPHGTANGNPLQFFPARGGYQAVFAIALDAKLEPITIEVDSVAKPRTVQVRAVTFPESNVVVEDELANPDKADRQRIDADNVAILHAAARAKGDPLFVAAFRRPPGEVTSQFGEWRTFNDGHRSQHLGLDLFAREGSPTRAINAGTVVLVRECFLAGHVVVVAHGGGIASAYYHLSKTSVAEGDTIAAGDPIGLAGHTGRATGPHLHLSIHVAGGMVDPAPFFRLKFAPEPAKLTRH
ncbi:MAG TPA: M23 family metallopeptidase [Kofleriaceae bacterium]|jgi:murein DD-endopeptidase MepM/ murein hydrolase activator NlpD